jgi:hypothetical protein
MSAPDRLQGEFPRPQAEAPPVSSPGGTPACTQCRSGPEPAATPPQGTPVQRPAAAGAAPRVKETPLLFGPARNLVGVWCEPQAGTSSTVCLLLINAGVVHRIGLHRINVKIARHMAGRGLPSLRFDLSGLGDSRIAGTAPDFRTQAVGDIQAAMDHIQRTQDIHCFAIFGICSGAFNGYAAALADPRIVGLSMMDGHAFRSWKTRWVRHLQRLQVVSGREMLAAVGRRLAAPWHAWRRAAPPAAQEQVDTGGLEDNDPVVAATREQFAQAMQTLVDRGVAVHIVHSGSRIDDYSYPGQFADVFGQHPFAAKVMCDHVPEMDHSVTLRAGQAALLARLDGWVTRTLP